MKHLIYFALSWITLTSTNAQVAEESSQLPDDALALKNNYQERVNKAIQPIRQQYISALNQLLAQAIRSGKLDDATAIKKEISEVSLEIANASITTVSFQEKLTGTWWNWNNIFSFKFTSVIRTQAGKLEWKCTSPFIVNFKFPEYGTRGLIRFNQELTEGSVEEFDRSNKKSSFTITRIEAPPTPHR
jgi:hypothetical protein